MLYLRKSHRSEEKLGQQIFPLRKNSFTVYVKQGDWANTEIQFKYEKINSIWK